ncbi:MAG: DUF1080 domain-containing protein [Bryobacteraceae bacterium]
MKLLIGLLSLACVAAMAQSAATNKPKYRTSPVGYDDTPVIPGQKWKVHDINRPRPAMVTPGAKPGMPPSDAIVLFDGKDLSKWMAKGGGSGPNRDRNSLHAPTWKVENGYFEVTDDSGDLVSKDKFGDAQLHVEWASPTVIDGDSQWRGNSGIILMERYEIQVLDSFNNKTYADGQAGAIYGWWPPMVNASRGPGEWQAYDIIFEAPRFDGDKLAKPAMVTVIHNGVVLHHKKEIGGPMAHRVVRQYVAHSGEESLMLQNHGTHVRYRNIWVRRLKGYDTGTN